MTPDRQQDHTLPKRSPRRRKAVGGRISITRKIFAYLTLFTAFILLVVWVLQIGLLNHFYSQSKRREMEAADRIVTEALRKSPSELERAVNDCAKDYLLCIRVFRVDGPAAQQLVSAEVSGACLIHRISDTYLTHLYNQAVANGGSYTRRTTVDALFHTYPDALAEWQTSPLPNKDNAHDHLRLSDAEREGNLLHARVVTGDMDEQYIILLDAELEPLSATVATLNTQFWLIAFILLWSALLFALLISRNIAKPIKKMNEAAKRLALGKYDADFRVDGYSEVVELSQSLTYASEELARTDNLQKELIANISHDLRTPLTMIIGYSEVMRDLPGENTPENVQVIIDETERLAQLVNDLLDLSKIRAGSRAPKLEVLNLTELTESTMLRYEKLTQKDGYRVEYETDASVEVSADRTMLLQVIYNLINNAINYTGEDKLVRVTQRLTSDGTRVRLSVTDSGVGIAPDQIPLIWDRYYKIDKVHRRAMIGTGLGLSIVKQILEAHHTTYGVESKLGEGSTFWFEMKVESAVRNATAAPADAARNEGGEV